MGCDTRKVKNLKSVYTGLIEQGFNEFIYLAGDSSLDNKAWILNCQTQALNGYEKILRPPIMV